MKIAIIPARGGSKRIPRKNIRNFFGKPMLHWPIKAAIESRLFDHIIVSTDSEEIAEEALKAGALVPFSRPKHLADDHAITREVINHAITECQKLFGAFEHCCCIYATSPFLHKDDLQAALNILIAKESNFVFSATPYTFPIQRAFFEKPDGSIDMFYPEHIKTRSQDLTPAFHDAGMFYWGKTESFLLNRPMFYGLSHPYLIPPYRVCDLDTPEDWEKAEWMMRAILSQRDAHE